MTGLQMQLLMSVHMRSQTNEQKPQECSFILKKQKQKQKNKQTNKKTQTVQAQNKIAFPLSDSILKFYVSVCFSLTFYETCVEIGTGIWISSLIF